MSKLDVYEGIDVHNVYHYCNVYLERVHLIHREVI